MRLSPFRCAALLALLALGATIGLAAAQSAMKPMSGDVVADRQRMMKLIGANWADAQAKFKAGNVEGIAVNAEGIAVMASHIPALFPQGSGTQASYAKPEVWEKWQEFAAAAKNAESWAERLRDAARSKDAANSCHFSHTSGLA